MSTITELPHAWLYRGGNLSNGVIKQEVLIDRKQTTYVHRGQEEYKITNYKVYDLNGKRLMISNATIFNADLDKSEIPSNAVLFIYDNPTPEIDQMVIRYFLKKAKGTLDKAKEVYERALRTYNHLAINNEVVLREVKESNEN